MKNGKRGVALAIFCSVLTGAAGAGAWDSVTRPATRNFRRNTQPVYVYGSQVLKGDQHLTLQVTNDRVGGSRSGASDDMGVSTVVTCDSDFNLTGDFTHCRPAAQGDLPGAVLAGKANESHAEWGWLALRLSADDGNASEHYLIARSAATLAGLMSGTTLFDPFFVRYAVANTRLASPQDVDSDGLPIPATRFLVGQSWKPTDSGAAAAHALRSISLLEVAELPDFSNSLADWAAGNEACPLGGLSGAFSSEIPFQEACHGFAQAMGALNVTHFAPLNREIWRYYHHLALSRMAECKQLKDLKGPFYDRWTGVYQSMSGAPTETDECESEAMTYEMFGQHFMQDAWSSGHMWKRFGHAKLEQFGEFKVVPSEVPQTFPIEQTAPRRAAVALMTGIIAGEIHGAKSSILKLARKTGITSGLISDDPLNAPTYKLSFALNSSDTEWVSDDGKYRGAGDLFWLPSDVREASVATDDRWAVERDSLLNCTAASMLEVYTAGPMSHGAPDAVAQGAEVGNTVPNIDTDKCWKHFATNQAMYASIGNRIPLEYWVGLATNTDLQIPIDAAANELILKLKVGPSLGFLKGKAADLEGDDRVAAEARDVFIGRLSKRTFKDVEHLRWLYWKNAKKDPFGTDSARGQIFNSVSSSCKVGTADCPTNVLGVPPIPDLPNVASPIPTTFPRDVDYVDQPVPQNGVPDPSDPQSELTLAMSRMFWRGNLERTCRTSVQNNAASLLKLRNDCLLGATKQGNANACTQCVALAELHIPNCDPSSSAPRVQESKCSAVGAESVLAPPAGLPGYWFDQAARTSGNIPGGVYGDEACFDGFNVAMNWCTGTKGATPETSSTGRWRSQTSPTCDGKQSDLTYGTYDYTMATEMDEQEPDNGPEWAFPMITARAVATTISPGADPCNIAQVKVSDSFDDDVRRELQGPINASLRNGPSLELYANEYLAGPEHPRCGLRQRRWFGRENCAVLEGEIGFTPPLLGYFYPSLGTESFDYFSVGNGNVITEFCMIRQPRELYTACSNGTTCNAGGECVPDEPAANLLVISTPPLPPPP